jgi:hypothetical protein
LLDVAYSKWSLAPHPVSIYIFRAHRDLRLQIDKKSIGIISPYREIRIADEVQGVLPSFW